MVKTEMMSESTDEWVFYLIGLFDTANQLVNPTLMYKGSSNHLQRRLRQHNGIIANGARRTTRGRNQSAAQQTVYKPVCVVSGFTEEKHVRQFEAATKQKLFRSRKKRVPNQQWHTIEALAPQIHSQIRHVLQALCCQPRWVSKGPDAASLNLTLEVWQPTLLPNAVMLQNDILPNYIALRQIGLREQQARLTITGPRARPWSVVPW